MDRYALELDDVDMAAPPILGQLAGLPIRGRIAGKAESSWSSDPKKGAGKASLTIHDAQLGPGSLEGFTVPSTLLGQLDLAFDMKQGRLRLASFQQKGGDITLKPPTMSVGLRPKFKDSSLDACFEIRPADAYLTKNPMMKTVIDLAQVKFRKDEGGYIHVPLSGTFASPRQRGGLCKKGGVRPEE